MMNVYTPADALVPPPPATEPPPFQWLPQLLQALRRRWLTICGTAAAVLGLAVVYLLAATPQFTASTTLLIDIRQSNPFRQQPIVADSQYENTLIESQVEILRSQGLARAVVAQHGLTQDPAFNSMGRGIIGTVTGTITDLLATVTGGGGGGGGAGGGGAGSGLDAEAYRQSLATQQLLQLVGVRRIGMTAVVEVSVRTPDGALSARLANALVATYLQNQVAALGDISAQASVWMQSRIKELRDEAIAADRAVQDYKAHNNILETDRGQFYEQQLGEYSTQLSQARARLAEAQAKFDRVRSLTTERLADAPMTEALENTIIVRLRQQYLDTRRREAEVAARFGTGHSAAVNARMEMAELQRSIQNELNRISETYRSELEVAKAHEAQLTQQLATLAAASAAANADRSLLRALQSSADSYRAIYENFLQRYTQAVQDQSFPITGARVMSSAVPPLQKSSPRTLVMLVLAGVAGVILGLGIALLRELLDRGLRTPAQVKAATGHDCLGFVPRLPARLAAGHGGEAEPSIRRLATQPSALRQVADQPASAFAEAVRGIAMRTTWQRRVPGALVVGCVAPQPGEGASTLAANLAHAFAEAGYSSLLVDLDLRRADLTRALAPQNAGGAAEIAEGAMRLEQVVWKDPQTGLHFLPAAAGRSAAHPARVLAPVRADRLLTALRAGYDRVVIDLPAFGTNADAGALAELLDGLLLVSTWGGMDGEALAGLLEGLHADQDKLLGIVLNRAELRQLARYGMTGYAAALRKAA